MNNFFQKPLSIITVVRNDEKNIEKTIKSILNQSYKNFEFIVIDGDSTDNTLEIIRSYSKYIDIIISEPDEGIYDAMNKGIKNARGEWIVFMNSGDEFNNSFTLNNIINYLKEDFSDIIYGDFIALNSVTNEELFVKSRSLSEIWKGMVFSHQSCFIRTSVLNKFHFNKNFKIVADYYQILDLYCKKYRFTYIPITISRVSIDGISYSNIRTIVEQFKVVHSFKPFSFRLLYFIYPFMLNFFKSLIGKELTNYARKIKWKSRIK